MIGFVAENLPKTGAVGLNLMGGAGMFAVSVYMMFMGGFYDRIIANKLPAGADMVHIIPHLPAQKWQQHWMRPNTQQVRKYLMQHLYFQ